MIFCFWGMESLYLRIFVRNFSRKCLKRLWLKLPEENLLLIPCGKAIQLARQTKLGDTLCRDGYHLNYVYGRYTAAAVWYEILTGKDVRKNRYKNPQMTCQQRLQTQKSAHKAVQELKKWRFLKKKCRIICTCQKKAVLLHPLLKNKARSLQIDKPQPLNWGSPKILIFGERRKRNHYTSYMVTKSWIAAFDEVR